MCQRGDENNDDYKINELVNKLMICDREKICE